MTEPVASGASAAASRRFVTFRVGNRRYALGSEEVSEVIRVPVVARVPQSPAPLLGIGNLRGMVLPVVGLRELLGMEPAAAGGAGARAIVLDSGAPVAVVVDRVDALDAVDPGSIEVREAELGAETGELLSGAFKLSGEDAVAKILDLKRLLDGAFVQRSRVERHVRRAGESDKGGEAAQVEETRKLVSFEVAGQEYALPLEAVQEILPAPESLTLVPRSEALVLGVTSLRDRLLPLLSLRGLLGFPPAPEADAREKVIVMKLGGAQVGLVADRARAVVDARVSSVDAIPQVLAARTGGEARIKAIYRGDSGRRLISILAPEQLFREDVMQRLAGSGEMQGADTRGAKAGTRRELTFLVFRLGADEFGLPIEAVDEVGQVPAQITRLPKTPKFLEGVINLRGDVLPVVDQRKRFDMPPLENGPRRRLVVVRSEQHRAGLVVDGVSDVLRVPDDAVEPAPDLTEDIARLVRGVINIEEANRIVLLLDPKELLTPAERRLLDAFQKSGQGDA